VSIIKTLLSSWCICSAVVADAADTSVGSPYLRTITTEDPPFGRLLRDTFPWDGVRIQRWRRETPREANWLVVWLDLQASGLGYCVSPVHRRFGPAGKPILAAYAQTTAGFVEEHDEPPHVDLAINTVAYWPYPAFAGQPVFLSDPVWTDQDARQDPDSGSWMLGLLEGKAIIDSPRVIRAAEPLVGLGAFLETPGGIAVRDEVVAVEGGPNRPRTLAGVNRNGRVLILLVVDGYDPGVSVGLSYEDAARVMKAAGAFRAIFLDGGGSSTLVGRDGDGRAVVINKPAGLQKTPGTLRHVAAHLGFTNLRRTSEPLPADENWQAPTSVVAWQTLVTWARAYPSRAQAVMTGCGAFALLGIGLILGRRWFKRRAGRDGPAIATAETTVPATAVWPLYGRRLRRALTAITLMTVAMGIIGQLVRDRWLVSIWLFYLPLPLIGLAALVQDLLFLGRCLPRFRFGLAVMGLVVMLGASWPMLGTGARRESSLIDKHHDGTEMNRTVRLMHWNVRWGGKPPSVETWESIEEDVRERTPDILVLSETPDPDWNCLSRLASRQGWSFVQCEHPPDSWYWYRLAVLSRWPVRIEYQEPIDNGWAMQVAVSLERRTLRLLVVDIKSNVLTACRQSSLADIVELCRRGHDRGEAIDGVMGDFNTSASSVAFEHLIQPVGDYRAASLSAKGWRGTWPAWCPMYDIDHVMLRADLPIITCELVTNPGTDHRGQVVTFRLPDAD